MKKVDFKSIKGLLTREQMKKVIGGAYNGGSCCVNNGLICINGTCCKHTSQPGCDDAFCGPLSGCGGVN